MDEIKQIIILGEKWKIIWGLTSEDDEDSQCYPWRREIHIKENLEYPEGIIRHEIIHAFLFESGLGFNVENRPLGQSETMVDWFALQYPKIKKVFEELGVEEGRWHGQKVRIKAYGSSSEKPNKSEIPPAGSEARARWICCPMCNKKKCEREADDCDVKIYLRNKAEGSGEE